MSEPLSPFSVKTDKNTMMSGNYRIIDRIGLNLILIAGTILRFFDLGRFAPWYDEALCIFQSERLLPLINGTGLSNNPPLYFIILYFWRLINPHFMFLRSFSVLTGIASIWLVYRIGRRVYSRQAGLIAALLLACSPMHIYYSQEIKMYSLNCMLVLSAILVMLNYIEKTYLKSLILLALLHAVMIYTHYYLFIVIIVTNLFMMYLIWNQKMKSAHWLIFNTLILFSYIPWLIVFSRHLNLTIGYVTSYIPHPGLNNLFYSLKNFSVGFHSARVVYWPIFLVFMGALMLVIRYTIKVRHLLIGFLILMFCFPICIIFLISQFQPLYLDRYFLYTLPTYLILCGIGLATINGQLKYLMLVLMIGGELISLPGMYRSSIPYLHQIIGEHDRQPVQQAVEFLKKTMIQDDRIIHNCRCTNLSFEVMWPERLQPLVMGEPTEAFCEPLDWIHSNMVPIRADEFFKLGDRVWLVLAFWDDIPTEASIVNTKQWLYAHGTLLRVVHDYHPIVLYYFEIQNLPAVSTDVD